MIITPVAKKITQYVEINFHFQEIILDWLNLKIHD